MKPNIHILSDGGIGDCVFAIKHVEVVQKLGYACSLYFPVRDEIFNVLVYLTKNRYHIVQLPLDDKEELRKGGAELEFFKKVYAKDGDLIYFVAPDNLGQGPLGFDYKRFKTSIQTVKESKILTHLWAPNGVIFLSLNSSTPQYQISGDRIISIIRQVARQNPNHLLYYNKIDSWNGQKVNTFEIPNDLPENVRIYKNQAFNESLLWLFAADYLLTVDCGIMHIGHSLGLPTTALNTRWGAQGWPWTARWALSSDTWIPANTDSISIGRLIKTNLETPPTLLLSRLDILQNLDADWKQALLLKEY